MKRKLQTDTDENNNFVANLNGMTGSQSEIANNNFELQCP